MMQAWYSKQPPTYKMLPNSQPFSVVTVILAWQNPLAILFSSISESFSTLHLFL